MARVAALLGCGLAVTLFGVAASPSTARGAPAATAPTSASGPIVVVADRDDDDVDGAADGRQETLPASAQGDLVAVDARYVGWILQPIDGADRVRLVAAGRALPWSQAVPRGARWQGVAPGRATFTARPQNKKDGDREQSVTVDVVGLALRDGARALVDMTRDHASIARTPPSRIEGDASAAYEDPDALRAVLEVPRDAQVPTDAIMLSTVGPEGEALDDLRAPLSSVPCADARAPLACFATAPLRFVMDEVDQKHPLVRERSLRALVGGAVAVRIASPRRKQAIRVLGPRASPVGPIGRLRATPRPFVLRVVSGGGPAIGGTDAGATALLRGELALASSIWGQCGVTFGPASAVDVHVVDPPPSHLLALGDDLGLPATGGALRFRADGREVTVPLEPGTTPDAAAGAVARALEQVRLVAVVSPNARIAPGAGGSVDVSVRRHDGRLAAFEPSASGAPLSSDATLVARIGSVDLSDGLQHFGDMDSVAGTVEERTLIKALDDGDPKTLEIVVIPLFAGGGRIGESFIGSDLSSVRNAVLLDRAGIRARRSSLTLAHEMGHVLMDLPGHPDDYGVDTPTLLMDSDGSDASPFGPRRLTVAECARVVRQAGPNARVPLLSDWPLRPIKIRE